MAIDRDKALAHKFPSGTGGYRPDDVILYQLGVGAGDPATDPGELEYTYEKNLKVLPSFATVAQSGAGAPVFDAPGLDFNPALLLHGEQEVVLHQPLAPTMALLGESRIADIYDKGKAAVVVIEMNARTESGEPVFSNRMSLFLRGEGGFGGPPGPPAPPGPPEREADGVIETTTLPQQALLYRLNGDKNPLHCDPEFAAQAGFDRPIIHGLCSYGIVCKAIVDGPLEGDPARMASYSARFRGVAFPGETYLTSYWEEGDQLLVEARSKERGELILSNAVVRLR